LADGPGRYAARIVVDPSDAELVTRAQGGDRAAVEQLLRRHQDRIHAVCRRMLGNPTDALDAAQEAMISVVRGLGSFDGRSAFTTWLYRLTTNACLDELRRRKRRPVVALPDHERDEQDHGGLGHRAPDPAEQAADRTDIDRAMADLPAEFRAAVVLRDLCRLDYAEIAEVLAIPPGTVRSRIARGRAALAAALEPGNHEAATRRPSEQP